MPRYFFHLFEGETDLVMDSDGASFSDVGEAKKEAIGLARDVVAHGLHRTTWHVVVADENGDEVLGVPLAEIRARKMQAWLNWILRLATYEPKFQSHLFTWLLTVALLAIIIQSTVLTQRVTEHSGGYQFPSRATVNVRFVSRASVADISNFLDAYGASLIDGPLPGGIYRLRVSGKTLSRYELTNIVRRMTQEKIVAFATAAQ